MSRRVEWSASALDDLDQSVAYITRESPAAAREVAATIGRNALALALRPTGRPGRVPGTYEKSVGGLPYVIAYAVPDEARLVVLRVIHTARDWPSGAWPKG